ncbi:MAG: hypothetical protein ABSB73_02985 [Solirubrobacteraceae bacterium]
MTYLPQLHRIVVDAAERLEQDAAGASRGRRARIAAALRGLGRRRLLIVVACGALLAGSAATAVALLAGRESAAPSGRLSSGAGAGGARRFVVGRYNVGVYPDFVAGAAGWCVWVGYRESSPVSAGKVPAAQSGSSTGGGAAAYGCADGNPIVSGVATQSKRSLDGVTTITTAAVLMTTPQVVAVRVSPAMTILTRADSALPDGYRLALEIQQTSAKGELHRPDVFTQPVALDAGGHAIAVRSALNLPFAHDAVVNWQRPASPGGLKAPPPAACEIDTSGVRGVQPFGGQVVAHVHGFPGLPGMAYLTCATVYFNYHGAPAIAALLLDARHPGTVPASFPYSTALSAQVENVEQPDGSLATFTARRVGPAAWLVVQASASLAGRLALLDRLRACVSLTRACA